MGWFWRQDTISLSNSYLPKTCPAPGKLRSQGKKQLDLRTDEDVFNPPSDSKHTENRQLQRAILWEASHGLGKGWAGGLWGWLLNHISWGGQNWGEHQSLLLLFLPQWNTNQRQLRRRTVTSPLTLHRSRGSPHPIKNHVLTQSAHCLFTLASAKFYSGVEKRNRTE